METNKMTEQFLDAAACEALGANGAAESAAYQQELAGAPADARRTDRQLRETVARLAAASPHMTPPGELRGRILQATAPKSFKMEDYRKATRDDGRYYRWGFYAAMVFLMAGAAYNMMVQTQLKKADAMLKTADSAVQNMALQNNIRAEALTSFLNSNVQQVTFVDEKGQVYGRAWVNDEQKEALVVLPKNMVPEGQSVQLTLPKNGTTVAYDTVLLRSPEVAVGTPGKSFELSPSHIGPDANAKPPLIAGK